MNKIKAFPYIVYDSETEQPCGQEGWLDMRDYFAAKAMQGLLAYPEADMTLEEIAIDSYRYADAMMKQRAK